MVTESALFYLVLITVLMVLLNALATWWNTRNGRHLHI
jgi:cbb3-type cytochrome oxidase maturation protein